MMLAVGEYVLGDLDPRLARMPTAFAGGVGDTQQEMCGALSGGLMVIGARYGRSTLAESDLPALHLAARYRERFARELGATRCAAVYGAAHDGSGVGSCATVVERAAKILLEMLDEQERVPR